MHDLFCFIYWAIKSFFTVHESMGQFEQAANQTQTRRKKQPRLAKIG